MAVLRGRMRTGIIYAIFTIITGMALAGLIMYTLNGYKAETAVVLTMQEIAPFTPITRDQVAIMKVPTRVVHSDTYLRLDDVVGKLVRTTVLPNEQLRAAHFAEHQNIGGSLLTIRLSQFNDPNLRAMAVPIDNLTGLGGTGKLQPGDRVDVVATVSTREVTVTKTIAFSVPVLGFITEQDKTAGIVLAVSPAQAEDIAFVIATGSLRLALNPYTFEYEATPGVSFEQFLRKHGVR